jgi:hypothetical protein
VKILILPLFFPENRRFFLGFQKKEPEVSAFQFFFKKPELDVL